MDLCYSSIEPGGYLKKAKNNDMVQALRGIRSRFSQYGRKLSEKGRDVKMFTQGILDEREVTKESIIKDTYASGNLPSPLFAKEG